MSNDVSTPPLWSFRGLVQLWGRNEKVRFLVVGIYNTLFGYAAFVVFYFLLHKHLHYLWLSLMAHFSAVVNAFVGHRYITFRVQGQIIKDFLRFNLSYAGALGISLITLPIMVEWLGIHPLVSQAILILVSATASYFLHKRISFRRNPE